MMITDAVGHQAGDRRTGESLSAVALPPEPAKDQKWAVSAVLTLNAATGLVEAVTFAHLGGLFAAFVTGTVVLAGLHLAAGGFGTLIPYAVAFGGFIVGAVLGGILVGRGSRAVPGTLRALAGEFTVLVLAVIAYTLLPQAGALVTLGLLAVGMAIQFSATKNLKVADLGFAAATGLIHGLVQDFARHRSVRLPRKILAILTLLAGAAVGGLVSAGSIPGALIIGVALVAAAAVTVAMADHRARVTVDDNSDPEPGSSRSAPTLPSQGPGPGSPASQPLTCSREVDLSTGPQRHRDLVLEDQNFRYSSTRASMKLAAGLFVHSSHHHRSSPVLSSLWCRIRTVSLAHIE